LELELQDPYWMVLLSGLRELPLETSSFAKTEIQYQEYATVQTTAIICNKPVWVRKTTCKIRTVNKKFAFILHSLNVKTPPT
jgi:hypothetical protein